MVLKLNYLDKAANSIQVKKKTESNRAMDRVDQPPRSSIWRPKSSIIKDFSSSLVVVNIFCNYIAFLLQLLHYY